MGLWANVCPSGHSVNHLPAPLASNWLAVGYPRTPNDLHRWRKAPQTLTSRGNSWELFRFIHDRALAFLQETSVLAPRVFREIKKTKNIDEVIVHLFLQERMKKKSHKNMTETPRIKVLWWCFSTCFSLFLPAGTHGGDKERIKWSRRWKPLSLLSRKRTKS